MILFFVSCLVLVYTATRWFARQSLYRILQEKGH